MYKLISAEERHVGQIAQQLSSTGYWRAGIEGNTLGLGYEAFMAKFIIKPQLGFTTVLVEENREEVVRGALISSSTKIADGLPDYSQYFHPKVLEIFYPIKKLKMSDGYLISFLSVDLSLRGKGFGEKLFSFAEEKARRENLDNISLIVWAFNISAVKFYCKMGMVITNCITCNTPEKIPLLYMQKNKMLSRMHEYFETEDYQNFHIVG